MDRIAVSNDVSQIVKSYHLWLVTGYCLAMGVVSQLRIVHHAMNGRGRGQEMGAWVQPWVNILPYSPWREQKYDKILDISQLTRLNLNFTC